MALYIYVVNKRMQDEETLINVSIEAVIMNMLSSYLRPSRDTILL